MAKRVLKVRLDEGVYRKFKSMHPDYGESSSVLQHLVLAYMDIRLSTETVERRVIETKAAEKVVRQ